ncbi:hypothetical protein LTR62_003086 [Meristemomyces frigidus]|uniref:Tat pathway signal sequence n=1 Tax=Meristemomyces frigidus TaxID=1508187 RepID=A0AAN7TFC9_9PEZI|nr:hypothetical protein LTR62_003086 [Meristemomyces frigidus]
MAFFGGTPSAQDATSSLRLPASKRISVPTAMRLSTITEAASVGVTGKSADDAPSYRSRVRNSNISSSTAASVYSQPSRVSSGRRSQDTLKTGPPAYSTIPDGQYEDEDLRAPVEGEKLAELRRNGGYLPQGRRRGGWVRPILITIGVLLVVALVVGLAVSLTIGRNHKTSDSGQGGQAGSRSSNSSSSQARPFPLGEYSLTTNLRTVNIDCTSNPSTWSCYPYNVLDPSNRATETSSLATFNWIITNTSATFATNESSSTSDHGIPSNLTISSTNNPFSIIFTNQSLTYISTSGNSTSGNSTSSRYTFSFKMQKSVIPTTSLTSSGKVAECFYNSTMFVGTLHLHDKVSGSASNSTSTSAFTEWPYAVEVSQSSPGGQGIPACYEMVDGSLGDEISGAIAPQPESSTCLCEYRNH